MLRSLVVKTFGGEMMFRCVLLMVFACAVCSCAVVPTLEEATGSPNRAASKILIADVVQRVKCEIADSFDAKLKDNRFLWLEDWTLKADLTLLANTQAGIAPSGSYTKFQKNAFNLDAGSTSLTSNTLSAVQQSFTVAVGANLGEQATRTEVVSFSLALSELHEWREHIKQLENDPNFPVERRICAKSGDLGLEGDLGLNEWVESAFYPVEQKELLAGYHPAPGTAKAPSAPGATAPPKQVGGAGAPPAVAGLTDAQKAELRKQIVDGYTAVKASILAAEQSLNDIDSVNTGVMKSLSDMKRKQLMYAAVSTRQIKMAINTAVGQLQDLATLTQQDVTDASMIPGKLSTIKKEAQQKFDDLKSKEPAYQSDADTIAQDKNDADSYSKSAKTVADHAQAVQKIVATIAVNPDPPIDSVLHSVQFVLAYGASVTPSWNLIQWKGPGLSGPAISGQGQRTHILQIALGPRAASDKTGAEQARLIQNATVLLSHP
jgi:hypothetical protein